MARCRGRGIAAALVAEVERLKARGCLKVNRLLVGDNEAARRRCQELGYDEMSHIVAMGKEL